MRLLKTKVSILTLKVLVLLIEHLLFLQNGSCSDCVSNELYFEFNGNVYCSGDSINITEIGGQPANRSDPGMTVVCVTTNVNTQCCRAKDNRPVSTTVGEWLYPNGKRVAQLLEVVNSKRKDLFAVIFQEQEIRLSKQQNRPSAIRNALPSSGVFTCVVPHSEMDINISANITILTLPGLDPPTTPILQNSQSGPTFIYFVWKQFPQDVIETYNLSYSYVIKNCGLHPNNFGLILQLSGSMRNYTLTNLEENSNYNISLIAINRDRYIETFFLLNTSAAVPSSPEYVQVIENFSRNVTISWNPPACQNQNDNISHYVIKVCQPKSLQCMMYNSTNTKFTITGLTPRSNYTIQVRTVSAHGYQSMFSEELQIQSSTSEVLQITSITYSNSCIICTSTGGPVDSVTWKVDNLTIARNNLKFVQFKKILNYESAAYQSYLCSNNSVSFTYISITCIVNSKNGSTSKFIEKAKGILLQVRISGVENCNSWKVLDAVSKDADILNALTNIILLTCHCNFTETLITNREFLCQPSTSNIVTYQIVLHGTSDTTVETIAAQLYRWASSNPTIFVQHSFLKILDICLESDNCGATSSIVTNITNQDSNATTQIIAGVVVIMIVAVILSVILLIVIIMKKSKQNKGRSQSTDQYRNKDKQDVRITPIYEDIEDNVSFKALSSLIDDIKTEECPAYDSCNSQPITQKPIK